MLCHWSPWVMSWMSRLKDPVLHSSVVVTRLLVKYLPEGNESQHPPSPPWSQWRMVERIVGEKIRMKSWLLDAKGKTSIDFNGMRISPVMYKKRGSMISFTHWIVLDKFLHLWMRIVILTMQGCCKAVCVNICKVIWRCEVLCVITDGGICVVSLWYRII